jgi:hypothetical protein
MRGFLFYLDLITIVLVQVSCHNPPPNQILKASNGTILDKVLRIAFFHVNSRPSSLMALVPVTTLPSVYPLNTFSQKV